MFSHTSKSNDFGNTLCNCFNERKYSFSLLSQTLSGYCGVVLKTTIKKGEAVDVNSSKYGIEDEILVEPQKNVKVEVEVINSLKHQVNQKDFNINEYIQNCNNTSDPLFKYITLNQAEKINNESKYLLMGN